MSSALPPPPTQRWTAASTRPRQRAEGSPPATSAPGPPSPASPAGTSATRTSGRSRGRRARGSPPAARAPQSPASATLAPPPSAQKRAAPSVGPPAGNARSRRRPPARAASACGARGLTRWRARRTSSSPQAAPGGPRSPRERGRVSRSRLFVGAEANTGTSALRAARSSGSAHTRSGRADVRRRASTPGIRGGAPEKAAPPPAPPAGSGGAPASSQRTAPAASSVPPPPPPPGPRPLPPVAAGQDTLTLQGP